MLFCTTERASTTLIMCTHTLYMYMNYNYNMSLQNDFIHLSDIPFVFNMYDCNIIIRATYFFFFFLGRGKTSATLLLLWHTNIVNPRHMHRRGNYGTQCVRVCVYSCGKNVYTTTCKWTHRFALR